MKIVVVALSCLVLLGSCTTVLLDKNVSAADGRAATLFLSGPDQYPLKGRVYLELNEGATPTPVINAFFPQAFCKRENCVVWQVVRPDGSFSVGGSVPRGTDRAAIPLNQIIGSSEPVTFDVDGEYRILVRVYFLGPDGEEYQSTMKGFVRVVILKKQYTHAACGDPSKAWEIAIEKTSKCKVQYTSQMRSAKCGLCLGEPGV